MDPPQRPDPFPTDPALRREAAAELHFTGWDAPALPLAADFLVENYREGGALDLSGVLVAVPGGRAGRRLLELLLERGEGAGVPVRPPRITTLGGLPEILAPPRRPPPPALLARRFMARALRDLPEGSLRRLIDPPPAAGDLVGWMRLAGLVDGLEEEVAAGGHDFASVAGACGRDLLFDDRERWRVLARAHARVTETLEGLGFRGRHEHRRRVVRGQGGVEGGFEGDVVLVGAAEVLPVVRSVLAVVSARIRLRALVHAPPELAGAFDALGCVRPGTWEGIHADLPEEAIRIVEGPRDQADALVEILRAAAPEAAEEVTVGVPDPEVIPFLEDRLAVEGVAARRAAGRRVEGTPPFRLLEAAAEYLADRSWAAFAALLRHPDVEGFLRGAASFPAAPAAVADRYHALHLPRVLAHGALPAGGENPRKPLAEPLARVRDRIAGELLDGLGPPRPLSGWAGPFVEFLLRVYGEGELDPRRPGDRAILEVAEGVRDGLEGLAPLPRELDDEVDGATALRLALDTLRGGSVPEPPEEEAVELLGWLELHLDDAPVLVVTGVNEPHLPESVTGDPFLPHRLRSALGLPDNGARRARDLYRLRAMGACRPALVLLSGRRNAAGDPLRPSRLLLAEEGERVARRLRCFLEEETEEEAPPPATSPGPSPLAGREDDPFALPPEREIRDVAPPEGLAVTAFRTLLNDPYRFALERVLWLEALDDQARELDPMGFGILAHEVLERLGRSDAIGSRDPGTVREALDGLLDGEVRRRFGRAPHPAVRMQVEQLRARLHAFAEWQVRWVADGWETVGVEVTPAGRGYAFDVDGRPFLLRGRIDRVDHHPDSGRWVLFDYKTSGKTRSPDDTHRKKKGRGHDASMVWTDLQLPLYRHLIRGVVDGEGRPLLPREALDRVELGFLLLPNDLEGVGEAIVTEWSGAELMEADEAARELVRRLRENRFLWDPDANTIRGNDPLGSLVGAGAYRDLEEEEEEGDA